jgi:hypothetical protein
MGAQVITAAKPRKAMWVLGVELVDGEIYTDADWP